MNVARCLYFFFVRAYVALVVRRVTKPFIWRRCQLTRPCIKYIQMGNRMHGGAVVPLRALPRSPVQTRSATRRAATRAARAAPALAVETRAAKARRLMREQATACVICLQPGAAARPSVCCHTFHLECLLQWAMVENTCPVCRAWFNSVLPGEGGSIPVEDSVQEPD